jgi:hypothetical protein
MLLLKLACGLFTNDEIEEEYGSASIWFAAMQ